MTPIEWLLGDDTGASSKTILSVMTGNKISYPSVPIDTSDFGRCVRILEKFPDWKVRLNEVSELYPEWGPLVEAWSELTELYYKKHDLDSRCELIMRIDELVKEGRNNEKV